LNNLHVASEEDAGGRHLDVATAQLFRGVVSMKESSTYQAILQEGWAIGWAIGWTIGAVREARKLLRIFGDGYFGPPDTRTAAAIERIDDLARLEALIMGVRSAKNWQELLSEAALSPRRKRRRPSPRGANLVFAGTLPEMHIRTADQPARSCYNPCR
jgi:hypothetical protein